MYAYVFRYNAEAFHNIPVQTFRKALGAELGTHIGSVYEPLNHSPLYQPHTKRRYRLNEEHWQAIEPTRFTTPVAAHAYANESVVISQPHLLAERTAMQAIADACLKLQGNAAELIARASDVQTVRN
jgi:hypothetical protein